MIRKHLGKSDLSVSPICLGTAFFGKATGEKEAFELMDLYIENGGNFIDTAHVYGSVAGAQTSESEKIIGKWLARYGKKDDLVIATKGGHFDIATREKRLSRADIESDLHESLTHLGVNEIDLYWLHRDDEDRDVEEILDVLEGFIKAGKIRYYGLSNWKTPRLAKALRYSETRSNRLIASQIRWSFARPADNAPIADDLIAMDKPMYTLHIESGLAQIPYSSQAGGYFQKRADQANLSGTSLDTIFSSAENDRRLEVLQRISQKTGETVNALSLAFLFNQPFKTIPIIGSKNTGQLLASLHATKIVLDETDKEALLSFGF